MIGCLRPYNIPYSGPCSCPVCGKDEDFFVWDGRSKNTIGPYSKGDAETLVESLNALDTERNFPALVGLCKKSIGPFYVKSEKERDKLRSLGLTKGICR